jgi:hypothetical protein
VPDFVSLNRSASARAQRKHSRSAEREDRDHGVLPAAPPERVAVPATAFRYAHRPTLVNGSPSSAE